MLGLRFMVGAYRSGWVRVSVRDRVSVSISPLFGW